MVNGNPKGVYMWNKIVWPKLTHNKIYAPEIFLKEPCRLRLAVKMKDASVSTILSFVTVNAGKDGRAVHF